MEPETIRAKAEEIAATGVDYVKIGFFPSPASAACAEALAPLAGADETDCRAFRRSGAGFRTAAGACASMASMASWSTPPTRRKGGCSTTCRPSAFRISSTARSRCGLMTGLSGSLEAPDIPRLLPFAPDFLGFRGALCNRHGSHRGHRRGGGRADTRADPGGAGRRGDRRVSTIGCWRHAAIRLGPPTRHSAPTRFSSATSCCRSRSAPTVSSTATPRKCAST